MERKKQNFVVKESNFSARVKKRWRFPRGKHSKVRQMHKGRPVLPSLGFGSPRATRGIDTRLGLLPVTVFSRTQLLAIDPTKEGVVLGRTVGGRKKLDLLALASEMKITVLDAEKLTTKIKTNLESRKKAKVERNSKKATKSAKKEEKKEEKKSESKKEDKKGLDEAISSEEEQKEQKKMKEKILTKRQ